MQEGRKTLKKLTITSADTQAKEAVNLEDIDVSVAAKCDFPGAGDNVKYKCAYFSLGGNQTPK